MLMAENLSTRSSSVKKGGDYTGKGLGLFPFRRGRASAGFVQHFGRFVKDRKQSIRQATTGCKSAAIFG
jgi:hypothetical protein